MSYTNIFDSHAHYDDELFAEDAEALLASFPSQGVTGVVTCGTNLQSSRAALQLAEKFPFVCAAVGFHGLDTDRLTAAYLAGIRKLAAHEKAVAIGEIGLDYHYEKESREKQLLIFEEQLSLAAELELPVIVHDREAHADTLRLLGKYRPRGVVHCFSGSPETAREVLSLGLYIGLGGAVTFKNAVKPALVAAMVPEDRLLVETDAPYMTPVPFRGRRNDSLYIPCTARRLAELRHTNTQAILDLTCKNAKTLFRLP